MKKFLSFLLIFVLCFSILTVPMRTEAYAVAGEVALGIGVVAILATAMGYCFANQGDFMDACAACYDHLSDGLKTLIFGKAVFENGVLHIGELVAADAFSDLWQSVKSFFNGGTVAVGEEFPTVANALMGVCPRLLTFDSVSEVIYTGAATSYYRGYVIHGATKENPFVVEWVGEYKGAVGNFKLSLWSFKNTDDTKYSFGCKYEFNDRVVYSGGGSGATGFQEYFIAYTFINGIMYIMPVHIWDNNTGDYRIKCVPNFIIGQFSGDIVDSREIPVDTTDGLIPDDAVYDAFKKKARQGEIPIEQTDTNALGRVLDEDIPRDEAIDITQAETLVDTGVIEEIDPLKFPILEDYKAISGDLSLKDIFPFCIPFDLFGMVSGLQANRKAPHFEWNLNVPNVVDYTFEIDLSEWDTAAVLLRSLELILFCVGLAFVTRQLIRS